MKSLLLFLASVFIFPLAQAQTNNYHSFPDSNAVWNYQFDLFCFVNGTANESFSISLTGDTSINSTTYKKLKVSHVQSQSTGICGGYPIGYKGAIRHDLSAKKVFIVPTSASTEVLLYDFTLQIGDTVRGYLENLISPDIVQSIDSILVGNTYRKRWLINSCYNIYFIEGVGSTYGLIEPSPGCLTDLSDYSLVCFQQEGQPLLPDTTTNCQIITSFGENSKQIRTLFFPNPFSNKTTLIAHEKFNNATLIIQNFQGQTVRRIENINEKEVVLNRNELATGIYMVNISQREKIISYAKLIVVDYQQ